MASPDDRAPTEKRSIAAQLVDMARDRYILGSTDDGEPFGATQAQPHIAMLLRGGRNGLRASLAAEYFADTHKVAGAQALTDAALILEGVASTLPPERLHLRVAEHQGSIYLDMGRTDGKVIHIANGHWAVTDTAPVRFLRTRLTDEMPLPPRGGNIADLWRFVNVTDEDKPVLLAALVAALVQFDVPHPVLGLFGEQGSAKSTTSRLLVDLIDPSPVPVRQAPRDPDSWVTAASGSWVVALDNLSAIPHWLSDSICRAATGDGNVKRALYTDAGLAVVRFRRCVILNGIDVGAVRPDLAERLAVVDLKRIGPKRRRPESQLSAEWHAARPLIWGGLLDLAASVHRTLGSIELESNPRMADFARVLAAVDATLGTQGLRRYLLRSDQLSEDSVSSNSFIDYLRRRSSRLNGMSGTEILSEATPPGDQWRRPKDWPRSGRDVTSILRRHAPALRALGWEVEDDGGHNHRNIVLWTIAPPEPPDRHCGVDSQASRPSLSTVEGG